MALLALLGILVLSVPQFVSGSVVTCGSGPVLLNGPGHPVEIQSPDFPSPVNASSISCEWTVKAQYGSNIKITVIQAELGSACFSNKLMIYDDTPATGSSPWKFPGLSAQCGKSSFPPATRSLVSKGVVTVKFQKEEDEDVRFVIHVEATNPECACDKGDLITLPAILPEPATRLLDVEPANLCPDGPCCEGEDCCIYKITSDVEVESPNYPEDSGRDLKCSAKIVAPENYQVAVNFLDMDLRSTNVGTCIDDYVELQDNTPSSHGVIGPEGLKFCGQHLPNHPAPSIFASAGNELIISYKTDSLSVSRGRGFKAKLSAVNPLCTDMSFEHKYGLEVCEDTCTAPPRNATQTDPAHPDGCKDMPLKFTLVDGKTGEPIQGARVNVSSSSVSLSRKTNLEGKTTFPLDENDNYTISITAEGYNPHTDLFPLDWCHQEDCNCDLQKKVELTPVPPEFCNDTRMVITVTDGETGLPLKGAAVSVVFDEPSETCDCSEGSSSIPLQTDSSCIEQNLSSLNFAYFKKKLEASIASMTVQTQISWWSECTLGTSYGFEGNNAWVNHGCRADFIICFNRGNEATTVVAPAIATAPAVFATTEGAPATTEGAPATTEAGAMLARQADVEVTTDSTACTCPRTIAEVVTGKKGTAKVPINANGNYRLAVTKDDYHPIEDWSEEVNCDLENCPCNVTLSTPLEPMKCENVTLSIYIRDVDTQEGIPEANVTVNTETTTGPMTWNVVTDEDGKAVVPIDPMGDFEISVSADGYVPHQKLKPIKCDVHDCEACLPATSLELEKVIIPPCTDAVFVVSVFDNDTSDSIPLAKVSISYDGTVLAENMPTNANGTLSLPITVNGSFDVSVTKELYEPVELTAVSFDCEMRQDSCADCDLSLPVGLKPLCIEGVTILTVQVKDSSTMSAIAGADVAVQLEDSNTTITAITDANGAAVVAEVARDSDYSITISKEGYEINTVDYEVPCGEDEACGDCTPVLKVTLVEIVVCEPNVYITVQYTDDEEAIQPVANASLTLNLANGNGDSLGTVFTNEAGNYSGPILEDGDYVITVQAKGFLDHTKEVIINREDICPADLYLVLILEEEPDIICPYNFTITVFDDILNTSLAGASVNVEFTHVKEDGTPSTVSVGEDLITDENGQVVVPMNANGQYSITVSHDGYTDATGVQAVECQAQSTECNMPCNPSINVPITPDHCDVDFSIRVRDALTLTPIDGAEVEIALSTSAVLGNTFTTVGTVNTNEEGVATVALADNGVYAVYVEAEGYVNKESNLTLQCNPRNCETCQSVVDSWPWVPLVPQFCTNATMTVVVRDTKANLPVVGAQVTVTLENPIGVHEIFSASVEETGELKVHIPSNGLYTVKIEKAGYISMSEVIDVNVTMGDCDLFAPLVVVPFSEDNICEGGVKVSLTWNALPLDLDLYSFMVDKNQTSDRCLTYYCEEKNPCGCTNFDIDNKEGGLNGSETMTYCCSGDASHMIYVDDLSGKGASLAGSGAKITITSNTQSMRIELDDASAAPESRYWLAGCLTLGQPDINFIKANIFSEYKPDEDQPLHCHSLVALQDGQNFANLNPADGEDEAPVTGGWSIEVTVRDSLTNEAVANATVHATSEANAEYTASSSTNAFGLAKIEVTQAGRYKIRINHESYIIATSSAWVKSEAGYTASITVGVSPTMAAGNVRMIMNWDVEPKDMDLYSFQVNEENSHQTCSTYYAKKDACQGAKLDLDNRAGGLNGSETITYSDISANAHYTYMVFVDDFSTKGASLQKSQTQITITDGTKSVSVRMPAFTNTTVAGVRYWLVGCMSITPSTFKFVEQNRFTINKPSKDEPKFCHNLFEAAKPTEPPAPEFCPSTSIKITTRDGLTNDLVTTSSISLSLADGDNFNAVASNQSSNGTGIVNIPVTSNGNYVVETTAAGYIGDTTELLVDCDVTKCDACKPEVLVTLSPVLVRGSLRIIMNWAKQPKDLDIWSYQINKDNSAETCYTSWTNLQCTGAKLDLDNQKGGDKGAETITYSDIEDNSEFVYMVYVHDYTNRKGLGQFNQSAVRLTVTDGVQTVKVKTNPKDYANERYWLSGCMRIVGDTFEWKDVGIFLNTDPKKEVPTHCLELFSNESGNNPATQSPAMGGMHA